MHEFHVNEMENIVKGYVVLLCPENVGQCHGDKLKPVATGHRVPNEDRLSRVGPKDGNLEVSMDNFNNLRRHDAELIAPRFVTLNCRG